MAKKTSQPETIQVRPLTDIEKFYIIEHYYKDKMTLEDLAKQLPGVDLNAIHACVNGLPTPSKQGEDGEARRRALAQLPSAGQFMGRDAARGVAVMTEPASEIADARKFIAVPSVDSAARAQPDKIHIIDPSKRAR